MREEEEFAVARTGLDELLDSVRSCMLATVSKKGEPHSSYAPVLIGEDGSWYVFVSGMAKHYANLRKTGRASVMLIEDEAVAESLFARKRLTVDCSVSLVARDAEDWSPVILEMEKRHGETMSYLKNMTDFDLFRMKPEEGRLVLGFGKAYRVWGEGLRELGYVGAGGHKS